jgi:hypothetical protein
MNLFAAPIPEKSAVTAQDRHRLTMASQLRLIIKVFFFAGIGSVGIDQERPHEKLFYLFKDILICSKLKTFLY